MRSILNIDKIVVNGIYSMCDPMRRLLHDHIFISSLFSPIFVWHHCLHARFLHLVIPHLIISYITLSPCFYIPFYRRQS